ncbi:MAG: cob(I)yrinic acid a,c-diamide adenosyltransferase [Patescibacteria group bacterium]
MKRGKKSKGGLVIYYYGKGKGKTTAAVGTAIRAAGHGWSVYFGQFIKSNWPNGEKKAIAKINKITWQGFGEGFVGILGDTKAKKIHRLAAVKSLTAARKAIKDKRYRLVVLDEVISAIEVGLLKVSEIVELIETKPKEINLIMTGHRKYSQIAKLSDIITEMKMIKHPYYSGRLAQVGIDF